MALGYRAGATAINPNAGVSTKSCNKPAGVASGDILVAHVTDYQGAVVLSLTGPTGWTRRLNTSSAAAISGNDIWTKVADGTEGASFSWSGFPSGADYVDISIDAYTGGDTTTPVDAAAVSSNNASSTSPTSPSITTVTDLAWVIFGIFTGSTVTITAPASTTQRQNYDGSQAIADQSITPAGATGTRTWTFSVAGGSLGTAIALRPASGAPPPTVTLPPMRTLTGAGI